MKAKVIIEDGRTKIVLTPESVFERRIIEDVSEDREKFLITQSVSTEYRWSEHANHKIELELVSRGI